MNKLFKCMVTFAAVFVLTLIGTASAQAAGFITLHSFDFTDGKYPRASLIQARDGNFYGTTHEGGGGLYADGVIFKIAPDGTLTTLYNFCSQYVGNQCTDGTLTQASLVQATDGNFYGTAPGGGAYGWGSIFKITSSGTFTTIYSFCAHRVPGNCPDGENVNGIIQGSDGNFYGTTSSGGIGNGTVFKVTPSGELTTIYNFCSDMDCTEGYYPQGTLVQASDGNFYGTTVAGGSIYGGGAFFKITSDGTLTTIYQFCQDASGSCGKQSPGALVQGKDGNFYGTMTVGGSSANCNGCGTVFSITPSGTLTTLYAFCAEIYCTDGEYPQAGLVQATDGNFYGTTYRGGTYDKGTLFKITTSGVLTTLHSFRAASGKLPYAALLQATDGKLYGTTEAGGTYTTGNCKGGGCGTVFRMAIGLGPFVETQTTSGPVGSTVVILGNNLTGATRVTFNGVAAIFRVVSSSEITVTVPAGATTGPVDVKTSTGKVLKSNEPYTVTP